MVPHVQKTPGRHSSAPSETQTNLVLQKHKEQPIGAVRLTKELKEKGHIISYHKVYQIMKANHLSIPSPAKSRKRKWVRFERKYSNAMWHVDWHMMKDPRFRGLNLVTYLDDSSRCIMAAQIFTQATSENAVRVLYKAVKKFGVPATILSDNGLCFVGRHQKKPKGSWSPTPFEEALLDMGIELINSRPYHPQTNGKLERFHRSIEEEIFHYDSLSEYVKYYNERRLHFSLDIDAGERPLDAFKARIATKTIRDDNPNWAEEDTNG